jgi:outer membrane immunogenic protein
LIDNLKGLFLMKANRTIVAALLAVAVSSPVVAADYGAPPPTLIPGVPVAVAPVDLWTGFYLGASAGAHFDSGAGITYASPSLFEPGPFDTRKELDFGENVIGGIQGGFLQQIGPLVIGAELSASALAASEELKEGPLGDYRTKATLGPILAAKGRLGFAVDRFLVYGVAGYAWSQLDVSSSFTSGFDPATMKPIRTSIDDTVDQHGFVYGGGVEVALSKTVSLGLEYNQYDFGDSDVQSFKVTNGGVGAAEKLKTDLDLATVQARLNFRF